VLHELAHGWAAIRCGDDTPIHTGHMTWNPLVHMGHFSLIMFALVGIAWGLMPINPNNFRGRFDNAIVAAAGPLMNLSLAVVGLLFYVVVRGWGGGAWFSGVVWSDPLYSNLVIFFWLGIMLNVVLMLFNLIPVPPLDGWRILSDVVPAYGRLWMSERSQMIALLVVLAIFVFGSEHVWNIGGRVAAGAARWAANTFAAGSAPPQPLF
jgi:Zn-dependent protease